MIIEFWGPPRSGKSEQIKLLKKLYHMMGKTVEVIEDREIEKEINIPPEKALEYNTLFFMKILEKMLDSQSEIIILDRGFHDMPAWYIIEHFNKKITEEQLGVLISFCEIWQKFIDLAIFIDIDFKTSMLRHKNTGVTGITDDYVINKEYLSLMRKAYDMLKIKYSTHNILFLDGRKEMMQLHETIVEWLKTRHNPG